MHAKQRRISIAGVAAAGFGKPDEFSQLGITHVAADFALRGEQGFGRKAAELEAAVGRQASHRVALGIGVALVRTLDALVSDINGDVFVHFHQDEAAHAAVCCILLKHGVAGCSRPREAVENEAVFVGGDLENTLQKAAGLGSVKL